LKVPHPHLLSPDVLADFRREVRLAARLDHPNILPVKDASVIDGQFVVALPLGPQSLEGRLGSRIATRTALQYAEQILSAVAHAHRHGVMHCDIKPDNLIFDSQGRLRLTDFGVAKVARKTIAASGSGTVGYVAPEQAMGKPSQRSDVFSVGLILYRLFAGRLPEWPYDWPPPGYQNLRRRVHPDLIALLKRATSVEPRKRYRDAAAMLTAFERIKQRAIRRPLRTRRGRRAGAKTRHWREIRRRQFMAEWGRSLEMRFSCRRCGEPVSEAMPFCPWCGTSRRTHRDDTSFPARCPRCRRGVKSDWKYCPWCWGRGFRRVAERHYADRRYEGRCGNPACPRRDLMPFMRYCPWCHRKVRKKWKVPGSDRKCASCGWGVVTGYWDYCPWCGQGQAGP
jgi:serine/threonine-protein kinase